MVKQKRRILITGVNGFLGKALWQYLKRYYPGLRVYGLVRDPGPHDRNFFICDLKHKNRIEPILTAIEPDYVFHCAGGRMAKRKELWEANVLTTKCLLEAIQKMKSARPRIVIPGSAAEYGRMPSRRRLLRESDPSRPLTAYGVMKLKQTKLGLTYVRSGLDVVVARIFNIMGEGTPSSLVTGSFAEQIAMIQQGATNRIIHTNSLEGKRDFLDIEDVCRALWVVAKYGQKGEIYNICSGHPVAIKELLSRFFFCAKIKDVIVEEDKGDTSSSFDVIGSNQKLKGISQWSPRVGLQRSLTNTLRSYKAKRF